MTRAEYAAYCDAVQTFMHEEGISVLSVDSMSYSFFSHSACDCCKRTQAGEKTQALAYHVGTGDILSFAICQDCVYYAEYGRLDDRTMMEITDNAT